MRYLKVLWSHDLPEEPVELYSELDDAGYEIRKVEIYRDGRCDFADGDLSSGTTMLGEGPLPSLEEIAEQEEFSPTLIEVADFERVWRQVVGDSNNS
ncbi:DUF6881 domain-containing protein [Streptomyces sp. NPDC058614]|uniref:DUF6881 domain-containing protein n=1 Tax=Streptomyces sp. NPDC058614 TaxID=3346557 RepID=UPI0036647D1F